MVWPCALAGHAAAVAPPLPAGAAALPLAVALLDTPPPGAALAAAPLPPAVLGAAGLAPVVVAVLGDAAPLLDVPPPPQAANVTLNSVTTLTAPQRWLNRPFIA